MTGKISHFDMEYVIQPPNSIMIISNGCWHAIIAPTYCECIAINISSLNKDSINRILTQIEKEAKHDKGPCTMDQRRNAKGGRITPTDELGGWFPPRNRKVLDNQ